MQRLRGATLIELMVSLALLAVVLSVTVGLIVGSIQTGHRARVRASLARQGQFVNTLLGSELRMAGLGVPFSSGTHIDDAYAGGGDTTFDTNVILATASAVGVVGDFPRPEAQYNTLGAIDDHPGGDKSSVYWHTENNGGCAPQTGTGSCNTGDFSPFFPGENGCSTTGSFADRTCPWGMRRASLGEHIQVVSGAMRWTHAQIVTSGTSMKTNGANGNLFLKLATTWNAVWPNDTQDSAPNAVTGQGFVTTIDRVFYVFDGTAQTISRIQCNGDPDPQNANWPNLSTNTLPSTASLQLTPTGGAANTCTGPEIIAKNVLSCQFSYFDNLGVTTTAKNLVRRVDWVIKMRAVVDGRNVEQDVVGSANIRNNS